MSRVAESLLSLALLDSPVSSLNSFLEAAGDPRLESSVLLITAHTAHYSAPGARQRRVLEVVSGAPALGLLPQILLSLGRPHPQLASPPNYHPVSVSHYHRLKIDWVNFTGILDLSKLSFLELNSIVKPIIIVRIPNTVYLAYHLALSLCVLP